MTEPRHSEMFAALAAFRSSMIRISGDLGALSGILSSPLAMETLRGWRLERAEIARALAEHAVTLAAGIEVLERSVGGAEALEDTQVD